MQQNEAEIEKGHLQLERERVQLERDKLEFERKKKDEKFFARNFSSITAGAISVIAILVSSLQVFIARQQWRIAQTQVNIASHQDQLAEAQTVQRFIPHLIGQEAEKELALVTMDSFVKRDVVTKLATKLSSKASEAALQTLAKEGKEDDKQLAQSALDELGNRRKQLVEQMFDGDKSKRIAATAQLIKEWSSDPKLIPLVLERANVEQSKGNQRQDSGVFNTIVLLQNTKPDLLIQYRDEIIAFLDKAKGNGPQTANLVSSVYSLLEKR